MSYCFDTISRIYRDKIEKLVEKEDPQLAMMFSMLLDEIHSANHRVKDALNKDSQLCSAVRELDEYVNSK